MTFSDASPGGLVGALDSAGVLPAEFRPAFLAAAREWFVPDRIWYQAKGGTVDRPVDRADDPERWLSTVYSDHALVTQFDDGATAWPEVGHRPSSSASMPSVVAGMLRALDPKAGHTVCEVGTGTGWNAALLAEIVGLEGSVTTGEVDPGIANLARHNLDGHGYSRVKTVEGDSATTINGRNRFDRLIVTAGVRAGQLPYAWIDAVKPGGIIVAPMRAEMASGPLVVFTVRADGTAIGHAVPYLTVGFMDLRAHRVPAVDLSVLRWDDPDADVTHTELAPWVPLLADEHRWPIAVALPGCRYDVWERTEDRPHGVAWLRDALSGSWASVVPDGADRYQVRQSGPRRLWDEAEAAYRWWQERGSPPLSTWEWTVTPERQSITLPPG